MGLCAGYFGSNTNKAVKRMRSPLLYKVRGIILTDIIHIPLDIQRRKKKGSVNLYYTLMFQHQTKLSYQDMVTHQALHPSLEIQMPQPQNLVISAIKNHSPPNAEYSTHQVSSSTASRLIHSNVEESPHISI